MHMLRFPVRELNFSDRLVRIDFSRAWSPHVALRDEQTWVRTFGKWIGNVNKTSRARGWLKEHGVRNQKRGQSSKNIRQLWWYGWI